MASTNGSNGKTGQGVAFALIKKKKKKASRSTNDVAPLADFAAQEDSTTKHRQPERTEPLVIPVQPNSMGVLAQKKKIVNEDDEAAAEALMRRAQDHFSSNNQREDGTTNFSADGSLKIDGQANTFDQQQQDEDQKFQSDLEKRAEDIPVDSNVYHETPIAEFGAALLRGMGWKGEYQQPKKETNQEESSMPRPHRLGLGATPILPEFSSFTKRMKTQHQAERDQRLKRQHQVYDDRRQEQVRLDKQQTLQNGSIVYVGGEKKKRARMMQLMGVPGLNRVLVQYEGSSSSTSVRRGDVSLVSRQDLEAQPYREVESVNEERSGVKKESHDEDDRDRKRIKREEDEPERYGRGRDDDRDGDKRHRDDDDRRLDDRDRRRSSDDDYYRDRKRRRREEPGESSSHHHWLIPNIRVRVVTKNVSSRYFKQKGLVLDVTHGGSKATLQMPDGQLLDRIPERYLETALPKVGGNAIVLWGKHRLAKGKLLERNSDSGTGVIQVFEDMNVVKLSLDDMAEWCGPLDDDMEL